MKARRIRLIVIVALAAVLFAAVTASAKAGDVSSTESKLDQLQKRLVAPRKGALSRYEQSIDRLERTLRKDDYVSFRRLIREGILASWQEVEADMILSLHAYVEAGHTPTLTAEQKLRLIRSSTQLKKVSMRLRRVRRILTRLEKLDKDKQRRAAAVDRLSSRYGRLLSDLSADSPGAALPYRAWMDQSLTPRLEILRSRDLGQQQQIDRLSRWTEEAPVRLLLGRIRQVARALEDLRQLFMIGNRD